MDEINIEEYTSDRQKENISVEINENENLDINYFKNTRSNVNDVHNMHKVIYAEDKDEKITRLTYLLTLEEMKRNNLLYNNNKLRYENVLKQIIIKKSLLIIFFKHIFKSKIRILINILRQMRIIIIF